LAYYRLYFMQPRTGHIVRFQEFEAANDEAAVECAEAQQVSDPMELWSGPRKVARFEAVDAAHLAGVRRAAE
jgi:hypothetical protein